MTCHFCRAERFLLSPQKKTLSLPGIHLPVAALHELHAKLADQFANLRAWMPFADLILAMIEKIVPISECVFMNRQVPEAQYAFQRGAEIFAQRSV